MKTIKSVLACLVLFVSHTVFSQDEGPIIKKERVSKAKIVFLGAGPVFKFLNNKSDYSGGLTLEGGYVTRINQILSVGPSISYSKFNYDESISDSFGDPDASGNNIFYEEGGYQARVVYLEGGDLSLVSAGFNVKLNLIPIRDNKKILPYVIAKPFIMMAKRTEITATSQTYYYANIPPEDPIYWELSSEESLDSESPGRSGWKSVSQVSGGLNIGLGSAITLPSGWGFYLQGVLGFTSPISYIYTSEYPATLSGGYYADDYPLVKKGFTSLSISIGCTYNF